MISQQNKEKIRAYFNGILPESETEYVLTLFIENEKNRNFEDFIHQEYNDYLKTDETGTHDIEHLLGNIHHKINLSKSKKEKSGFRKLYGWYSAAAAVLLVPILFAGLYWLFNQKPKLYSQAEKPVSATLHAPFGSRINFTLPDGTTGWLNSGSKLDYQVPFNESRKISLTGEVWLDVFHDENHPFEVLAGNIKIKVLGTEFNMNAYPEEKYVEVVLNKGKVEFSASGTSNAIQLKPNERLVFRNDSIKISATDAFKYSAWKEGKLVFRGDPMPEVARRIERWYNVEVELADIELNNYVIRGTFEDDSLEDVFRYLSMTSPISYKIYERKIEPDGSYSKTKVVIQKKHLR